MKKVTYPDFYAIINALLKGILGSEVSLPKGSCNIAKFYTANMNSSITHKMLSKIEL